MKKFFPDLFPNGKLQINWGRELMASVVVFLVALPLCMGIAIASGVPPALGLLTGIIGGLVVGSIAGSPLQVSGPAAGLAVICYEFVDQHGVAMLGVAVFAAGSVQAIAGGLKLGRWFRATSPAVIQGMLAGIGVLIFASQFHVMVDDDPRKSGLANLVSIPESILKGVSVTETDSHHLAAAIGVATLLSLVLWNTFRPKVLKAVPGALIAVVVGTGSAFAFGLDITYVEVPAAISNALNVPALSDFSNLLDPSFMGQVFALAIIASAETLLCAAAADQMHTGPRTRYDQELMAQGIGNMTCGVVGALPMTGVIVRTSANIEAGAKTRVSAIAHGVLLLGLIVALPFVLELIPRASLAAILVYTGYRLMKPQTILHLWRFSRGELVVYLLTVTFIVADNLLAGVLVGLAASAIRLLVRFSHLEVHVADEVEEGRAHVHLVGAATFVNLPRLAEALEAIEPSLEVHIHMRDLSYIDHACLELLSTWESQREAMGGQMVIEWDELHARYHNKAVFKEPNEQVRAHAQAVRQRIAGADTGH